MVSEKDSSQGPGKVIVQPLLITFHPTPSPLMPGRLRLRKPALIPPPEPHVNPATRGRTAKRPLRAAFFRVRAFTRRLPPPYPGHSSTHPERRRPIPAQAAAPDDPMPDESPASSVQAVARRLREARRATGLTQAEVAKRIGVNRRAIHEWEAGTWQPHRHIPELAEVYGVSATFLLFGVEPASVELRMMREAVTALQAQVFSLTDQLREVTERTDQLLALAEGTELVLAVIRGWIEDQSGPEDR